jgi:hypothetical protein
MDESKSSVIHITCPCCEAILTVDPALGAVLDHKVPAKPQVTVQLKDAVSFVNKSKVLEAKFQELFKKAKEEPITKPLKDIDLD